MRMREILKVVCVVGFIASNREGIIKDVIYYYKVQLEVVDDDEEVEEETVLGPSCFP